MRCTAINFLPGGRLPGRETDPPAFRLKNRREISGPKTSFSGIGSRKSAGFCRRPRPRTNSTATGFPRGAGVCRPRRPRTRGSAIGSRPAVRRAGRADRSAVFQFFEGAFFRRKGRRQQGGGFLRCSFCSPHGAFGRRGPAGQTPSGPRSFLSREGLPPERGEFLPRRNPHVRSSLRRRLHAAPAPSAQTQARTRAGSLAAAPLPALSELAGSRFSLRLLAALRPVHRAMGLLFGSLPALRPLLLRLARLLPDRGIPALLPLPEIVFPPLLPLESWKNLPEKGGKNGRKRPGPPNDRRPRPLFFIRSGFFGPETFFVPKS